MLNTLEGRAAQRRFTTERYIRSTLPVLYVPLWKRDGVQFLSEDGYGHLCSVIGATLGLQGRTFDGIDDQITMPVGTNNFTTENFTLEAWVKFTSLTTAPYIINNSNSTSTVGYELYVQANGALTISTCKVGGGQYSYTAAGGITAGVWLDCVGVRNGASGLLYVNGVNYVDTAAVHQDPATSTELLRLGYYGSGTPNYILTGTMGEVRIYNRALTALEVQRNYLSTKWRYS